MTSPAEWGCSTWLLPKTVPPPPSPEATIIPNLVFILRGVLYLHMDVRITMYYHVCVFQTLYQCHHAICILLKFTLQTLYYGFFSFLQFGFVGCNTTRAVFSCGTDHLWSLILPPEERCVSTSLGVRVVSGLPCFLVGFLPGLGMRVTLASVVAVPRFSKVLDEFVHNGYSLFFTYW